MSPGWRAGTIKIAATANFQRLECFTGSLFRNDSHAASSRSTISIAILQIELMVHEITHEPTKCLISGFRLNVAVNKMVMRGFQIKIPLNQRANLESVDRYQSLHAAIFDFNSLM